MSYAQKHLEDPQLPVSQSVSKWRTPKCMLYLKNLVKIIFVDEMNVSNGKEVQVQIEQITEELPMSPAYLPSC